MEVSKVTKINQAIKVKKENNGTQNKVGKNFPKAIVQKPLNEDTFEKQQPVDLEGKIVNKNGVINN